MLLAALAGCNGSNESSDGNDGANSTFKVAERGPVVGVVKPVADTEPTTPVVQGSCDPVSIANSTAARFTEIAPDTTGCATFQASLAYEYNLGNLVARSSLNSAEFSDGTVFMAPIKGWVRYPEKAAGSDVPSAKFPVIVFQHGNHGTDVPNYQGYDYLAKDLAEHGYVVLSIDANANNDAPDWDDQSSQSRGQLILGTLDRLRQIDDGGQTDENGKLGALNVLKGKLDFDRVGIMGHSRGGQGVANAIKFNVSRRGVAEEDLKLALKDSPEAFEQTYPDLVKSLYKPDPLKTPSELEGIDGVEPLLTGMGGGNFLPTGVEAPTVIKEVFDGAIKTYNIFFAAGSGGTTPYYHFKGAFMLAPTDFAGVTDLNNVPLANLLPSCDGDVSNLQGARAFDHNRFAPEGDTAPRYQISVRGANHNFYNTIWDKRDTIIDYCKNNRLTYLTSKEQRRGGLFLINSFMRYHVGGEQKFASYWNGTGQLPPAVCRNGKGTCDERIVLTVQKDGKRSKLIQRFEEKDALTRNALGGAVAFSGFDDDLVRCGMASGGEGYKCEPKDLIGFDTLMSKADHVRLSWSEPKAMMKSDLAGVSAAGYDSLTFRVAVAYPMGQEVLVTLTDTAGKTATVTASDFSDALYNVPRPKADGRPMVNHPDDATLVGEINTLVLNMVAIPLKAFKGIDSASLKELKMVFPKGSGDDESGKAAITDIEFQNLEREKSGQTVAKE